MTVVLEYRSGKTEIVTFVSDDAYPARIRIQRIVIDDRKNEPGCEQRLFYRERWLRTGAPVYVEAESAPRDAP
jgi:hypothetical protein